MTEDADLAKGIELELRKQVSYIAGIDLMQVDASIPFKNLGVDSMMAIEVMAAMEKKFKIQIQEKDVMNFKSFKETVAVLIVYLLNK